MGTPFKVEAGEVAGLGKLIDEIGANADLLTRTSGVMGSPASDGYTGIMQLLVTPLNSLRDATSDRQRKMTTVLQNTGVELNKAAWMYVDQDAKNYAALNAHTNGIETGDSNVEEQGATEAFVNAVPYSGPEFLSVPPCTISVPPNLNEILAQGNEWVQDILDYFSEIGYNPLTDVLEKIAGNWNDLRRVGGVHQDVGETFEKGGLNLEWGRTTVDSHWDGQAATSFQDFAGRLSAGMQWEGPIGRLICTALERVADEIERAVTEAVNKIIDVLKSQVEVKGVKSALKFALKKVPVAGWAYQLADIALQLKAVMDHVLTLVESIQNTVNSVKDFIEFVKDPVGNVEEGLEAKLKPITDKIEDAQQKAEMAQDIVAAGNIETIRNKPDSAYEVGSGTQPWGS
ncbi:hypothetical protein [Nocardia sp. NPDC058480]|uniref:hypothetical protein n=1 Tax=unclassified Nocardia TaxID=2637762 RepID=UPI00364F772C